MQEISSKKFAENFVKAFFFFFFFVAKFVKALVQYKWKILIILLLRYRLSEINCHIIATNFVALQLIW